MDPEHATLPELLGWAAEEFADVEAIVDLQDGGRTLRYRELLAEADELAAALVAAGLQPGDAVALWAPNIWEWPVTAFGVLRAGGVLVPVNTRFRGAEAAFVLRQAHVRMLVTVNGFLGNDYVDMLRASGEDLPELEEVVILRGDPPEGCVTLADLLARANPEARADVPARAGSVAVDDTSLVMFTSGTTGLPKGAMIRGSAIIRAFSGYSRALGVSPGDRYLIVNPFFHAFGFNGGVVACMLGGGSIVPLAVWDVPTALSLIEDARIALFPGPPALFQGMLNHPRLADHDLSSLRGCVTGAATIPEEMVVGMRERLGFERVLTAYGMTETSGLASLTLPGDDPKTIATTSGRAIPGVELRVVGDDGGEVPRGMAGELVVRGFPVMKGYLDDPDQTAAAIDPDGWLHTGDIAVMDDAGYIDITDRKKDMYIVGGFNAYPAEIERMIIEHPGVGEVSVVGVPDERLGEVGGAFVVPAPGAELGEDDLVAWCRERMANYKVPRHVWFVESLPLNPSNKVLKYELRERARRLTAG